MFWRKEKPKTALYPYGTLLQHRDGLPGDYAIAHSLGFRMHGLKAMVVDGRVDKQGRIQVCRITGGIFIGEVDTVYPTSWEPVDAN